MTDTAIRTPRDTAYERKIDALETKLAAAEKEAKGNYQQFHQGIMARDRRIAELEAEVARLRGR